jgi:hypothetical protein
MPANNANFIGKAAYWGIDSAMTATSTNLATMQIQKATFTPFAERADIKAVTGSTNGVAFGNPGNRLVIEGIVVGTGLANAKAQAILTPPIGDVVTIAATDDTELTATNTGKYFVADASKDKSVSEMVRMNLTLEQFIDNDVTATVSA